MDWLNDMSEVNATEDSNKFKRFTVNQTWNENLISYLYENFLCVSFVQTLLQAFTLNRPIFFSFIETIAEHKT